MGLQWLTPLFRLPRPLFKFCIFPWVLWCFLVLLNLSLPLFPVRTWKQFLSFLIWMCVGSQNVMSDVYWLVKIDNTSLPLRSFLWIPSSRFYFLFMAATKWGFFDLLAFDLRHRNLPQRLSRCHVKWVCNWKKLIYHLVSANRFRCKHAQLEFTS